MVATKRLIQAEVMEIPGHRDDRMLRRYLHSDPVEISQRLRS